MAEIRYITETHPIPNYIHNTLEQIEHKEDK